MKILITGSAGFVGKKLYEQLGRHYQVFGISRRSSPTTTHPLDITAPEFEPLLSHLNPDIIIHAAALANVDYCETHPEEANKTNVAATKTLTEWAAHHEKKVIYISTDYVYPGEKGTYDEHSPTHPLNVYGKTKLEAEKLVARVPNHTILRTTVVFGYDPGGLNFLMQMLNITTQRKIPNDQINNPTSIAVLGEYVGKIIEKDIRGLFIATGPTSMNRFEFALLIADIFNRDKSLLTPIKTSEFKQAAQRPLNNATSSRALWAILGYSCPSLIDSLHEVQREYTKLYKPAPESNSKMALEWKRWQKPGDSHLVNRVQWDEKEFDTVKEVFNADWFGYGAFNKNFEKKIADYTGIKHIHLTNSGSSAILTAVKSLIHKGTLKRGDLVLHPITTFATSISAALDFGIIPVFVETAPYTYVVNPDEVEKALKKYPQIKGLILPHLLGNVPDMDRILSLLGNRFLIEDCCDTLGCYFNGRHVGSFGTAAAFSFYGSHHITAAGVGGAFGTNNDELSPIARSIIFWGRDFGAGEEFLNRYKYLTIGTDSQMTAIQAAFGAQQMTRLPQFIRARKTQFDEMTSLFANCPFFHLPRSHPKAQPSWFAYPLVVKPDAPFSRADFVSYLAERKVEIRPIMCGNILKQKIFRSVPSISFSDVFRIGDEIEDAGLFIPCWGMPEDQKQDYYQILKSFLQKYT